MVGQQIHAAPEILNQLDLLVAVFLGEGDSGPPGYVVRARERRGDGEDHRAGLHVLLGKEASTQTPT